MQTSQLDHSSPALELFEDLNGYEKGVVARAFLNTLIKQGSLSALPSTDSPGEITISVERWQLMLLARFSEADDSKDDDRELLLERLCQLS